MTFRELEKIIAIEMARQIPSEERCYIMSPVLWEHARQNGVTEERDGEKYFRGIKTLVTDFCAADTAYVLDKRDFPIAGGYISEYADMPTV